jgi:predicted XRE-type DNA-binding protein
LEHAEASWEEYEDVWEALGFSPEEAADLQVRSELMFGIEKVIKQNCWGPNEAASQCGVARPRIVDLMRGRISNFSIDALVTIATRLGCDATPGTRNS